MVRKGKNKANFKNENSCKTQECEIGFALKSINLSQQKIELERS